MKGITAPNPLRRHGLPGLAGDIALAACDGSNAGTPGVANVASSSASTSSSASRSALYDPLAFPRCMRAHGVMDFHGGPTSMACPVAVATCAGAGSP
jgi:hypothetical protein